MVYPPGVMMAALAGIAGAIMDDPSFMRFPAKERNRRRGNVLRYIEQAVKEPEYKRVKK